MGLTEDQFKSNGYLVIPDFVSYEEVESLKEEAFNLKEKFNPDLNPKVFFEIDESAGAKHIGDKYFLESGDKIRYFLEPDSRKENKFEINKIGHALHTLNPQFHNFSCSDRVRDVAKSLGFEHPAILQSMLIFKSAKIGGAVPPHQDSTFLHTEPKSAVGFWIPLQDCTLDNGCLYFWPGSHKISKRFVRNSSQPGNNDPNDCGTCFVGTDYSQETLEQNQQNAIPAIIPAGTLVLIDGSVMHHSNSNTSQKPRLAYTFHLIETKEGYLYDEKNWLQPTKETPFTILY